MQSERLEGRPFPNWREGPQSLTIQPATKRLCSASTTGMCQDPKTRIDGPHSENPRRRTGPGRME